MKVSGLRVEGRPSLPTVLVFEYVTGGGLAGRDLPESWATEGLAILRAIAEDFAAVPGVRVVATIDARLASQAPKGVGVRVIDRPEAGWLESSAIEADFIVLVAPESGEILETSTEFFERIGVASLGSSPAAVALAADKARLARHFLGLGIPSPTTWTIGQVVAGELGGWDGPILVKPRMGAGSVDTVVLRDRAIPSWVVPRRDYVAQPYLPGEPMSASLLVDAEGRSTILGVAQQRIEVDDDGRIAYRGGVISPDVAQCPAVVLRAVESVIDSRPGPSLRGFVGVDYLLGDRGEATVLEINPRPTTSYVGLARLYPPGLVAGAWLAGHARGLLGTDWPERLRVARDAASAVTFDADGTIQPEP